jgi:hypothetical protein
VLDTRKKYPYINTERLHQTTASRLPSRQDHKAATVCLPHGQLAQGSRDCVNRAGRRSLYGAHSADADAGTGIVANTSASADAMENSAL